MEISYAQAAVIDPPSFFFHVMTGNDNLVAALFSKSTRILSFN
jgi:hypothetical protein